jgi:hypothetical protein
MATDESNPNRPRDSQDERQTRERESVTGNRSEFKDSGKPAPSQEMEMELEDDKTPAGTGSPARSR